MKSVNSSMMVARKLLGICFCGVYFAVLAQSSLDEASRSFRIGIFAHSKHFHQYYVDYEQGPKTLRQLKLVKVGCPEKKDDTLVYKKYLGKSVCYSTENHDMIFYRYRICDIVISKSGLPLWIDYTTEKPTEKPDIFTYEYMNSNENIRSAKRGKCQMIGNKNFYHFDDSFEDVFNRDDIVSMLFPVPSDNNRHIWSMGDSLQPTTKDASSSDYHSDTRLYTNLEVLRGDLHIFSDGGLAQAPGRLILGEDEDIVDLAKKIHDLITLDILERRGITAQKIEAIGLPVEVYGVHIDMKYKNNIKTLPDVMLGYTAKGIQGLGEVIRENWTWLPPIFPIYFLYK